MCRAGLWFSEHARDVEVFHGDGAVGGGHVGGELVDRVCVRIRDPSVDTGHFSPGGFPAGRGSLPGAPVGADSPRQRARSGSQCSQGSVQVSWVGHRLTGGQHGQSP